MTLLLLSLSLPRFVCSALESAANQSKVHSKTDEVSVEAGPRG